MLIEVHILQNHAPSNLNRDDTGSPKEAVFGGYKRARISSQCLKRSIRRSDVFREELEGHLAYRTKRLADKIAPLLIQNGLERSEVDRMDHEMVGWILVNNPDVLMFLADEEFRAIAEAIGARWTDLSAAISKWESETGDAKNKARNAIRELCREIGGRVQLAGKTSAVDIALFGRMVADSPSANVEASCQFAHAISTHKIDHEFDYFTAVDDLKEDSEAAEDAGAGMIGDIEFNSACYYKYFNIHVDGLIDNLTGKAIRQDVTPEDEKNARQIAGKTIRALIEAACRVSPTGKQNSFAAHQPPSLVWIEIRDQNLPVSYANAFCSPVNPRAREGLETGSANALKKECETLTEMYSLEARARLLLEKTGGMDVLGVKPSPNLKAVLDQVEGVVLSG